MDPCLPCLYARRNVRLGFEGKHRRNLVVVAHATSLASLDWGIERVSLTGVIGSRARVWEKTRYETSPPDLEASIDGFGKVLRGVSHDPSWRQPGQRKLPDVLAMSLRGFGSTW